MAVKQPPTFQQTVDTLANWINTCDNEYRLDFLKELKRKYISERFIDYATPRELALAEDTLDKFISLRRDVLIRQKQTEQSVDDKESVK